MAQSKLNAENGGSAEGFQDVPQRTSLPSVQEACNAFVRTRISEDMSPAPFQGYCSYTVFVGESTVIQFRPPRYGFNTEIVAEACEVFGSLVPETKFLGSMEDSELLIYSMRRLPGRSLSDCRCCSVCGSNDLLRRRLVLAFARIQGASWKHTKLNKPQGSRGKIGSSLKWRVGLIASSVPSRFRRGVSSVLSRFPDIERLPWTLSHGDFTASNVLVCPDRKELVGLLDWAEAEYLPFGIGMYGLEELLGEDRDGSFAYYPEVEHLRQRYWDELTLVVPELREDPEILQVVKIAQIFGVLLWHAIAFDDGKLSRAVEDGVDHGEIQRLDLFLLHPSGPLEGLTRTKSS